MASLDGIDPPDTSAGVSFDWERLDAGLRELSNAHQEILRLRYYGGLCSRPLSKRRPPRGRDRPRLRLH
jgi:hypothetical protein